MVTEREEGEEGREPKRVKAQKRISQEERDKHELTHTPYRSWCKYCVWARGREMVHHRIPEKEKEKAEVTRISIDYMFMSEKMKSS